MKKPDTIYVIMVMEKMEHTQGKGFPDFGYTRLPGWYSTKETAIQRVKENCPNIWHDHFDYALIEEIEEGIYKPAAKGQRWWFQYNQDTDCYEEIEEPEGIRNYSGLAMGEGEEDKTIDIRPWAIIPLLFIAAYVFLQK